MQYLSLIPCVCMQKAILGSSNRFLVLCLMCAYALCCAFQVDASVSEIMKGNTIISKLQQVCGYIFFYTVIPE